MPERKPVVIVIDSHAIIHRAFHALPPLSTKDGTVVNAVYGFLTIVFKALKQLKPTHVAVTFDAKGPTFRHQQFSDYKGTRKKQPDELYAQIDIVKRFVDVLGFPRFELSGYEADDIIGTIVTQLPTRSTIYIVTGDMDTLQLVNGHVKVLAMRKGVSDTIFYDIAGVAERYGGLKPKQVIDYKALCGDASDNIPGIPGIGPKTAIQLLNKHGSLENVLKHAADYTGSLGQKLQTQQDQAVLSKKLATIECAVPITVSLSDVTVQPYERDALVELLKQYEFKSLLKSVETLPGVNARSTVSNAPTTAELFSPAKAIKNNVHENRPTQSAPAAISDAEKLTKSGYTLIRSDVEAKKLVAAIKQQDIIALDTETTSLEPWSAELVGMSISWQSGTGYYIPANYVQHFFPILENPNIKKTGHNLKFDYKILRAACQVTLAGIVSDTMLASYVLNPGSRGHGLDHLAFTEFGYEMMPYDELVGTGKQQQPITEVSLERLAFYAAEDADFAWRLYETLSPRIKQQQLQTVLQLEIDLIPVLGDMELAGIAIDNSHLQTLHKRLEKEIKRLEKKIFDLAGEEFNIASPKQLKVILFDRLNINTHGLAKTKTGISTAASELEKMRGLHPIIDYISEYREVTKLQSTYVEALPKMVHPKTHRIHTNYQQTIAATGRLSSTDPNLQNIPIRTALGREIRQAFVAMPGKVLVSLDYSQIELRIIAHLAHDITFIKGFKRGADIHTQTAAEIQGVAENEVTPEMRRAAKSINFGILYGMGAHGLARDAGISNGEAREYLERYFKAHAAIRRYIEETKEQARQQGYVSTLMGRRRYLPDIHSTMAVVRAAAERAAINMPAQGTAADIMKLAMLAVAQAMNKGTITGTMLLQVHDELVFEITEERAEKEAKIIKDIMENVIQLQVPLIVDVGIGHNWNEV